MWAQDFGVMICGRPSNPRPRNRKFDVLSVTLPENYRAAVGIVPVDDETVVASTWKSQSEVSDAIDDLMQSELIQRDSVNIL